MTRAHWWAVSVQKRHRVHQQITEPVKQLNRFMADGDFSFVSNEKLESLGLSEGDSVAS